MMKVVKWLDEHMEEFLLVILLVVIACVSLLQLYVGKLGTKQLMPRLRADSK